MSPIMKRRKLEHISSDEDADDASFASFGDSIDELDGEGDEEESQDPSDENGADGDVLDEDEEVTVDGEAVSSEHVSLAQHSQRQHPPTQAPRTIVPNSRSYSNGASKSNIFQIQVDQLLEQIRPKRGKREAAAEEALHKLKGTIERIPAREALEVEEAERQLLTSSKVAVPFPDPRPSKTAKYKLAYTKPTNINVVGSYALKTASRAKRIIEIDMTVAMPSSLFQDKDYLNHRYFYKRAYYLACIAAGLKQAYAEDYQIRFRSFHDNRLKPNLVVSPAQGENGVTEESQAPRWQINIIPCVAADVFPEEKLLPDRNCVRPSRDVSANGDYPAQERKPTSFYNSSIRSDMLMSEYLKLLHCASKQCAAFSDACLLGNTWLRTRGFDSNIHDGGFGSFELSALMALLLEAGGPNGRPLLSDGYNSHQLLKATLQLLARRDLSKEVFIIGEADKDLKPIIHRTPVLWDSVRGHNLLFKMTVWSYKLLGSEAQVTLNILGDQQVDGFEAAFVLRRHLPLYRYDYILRIDSTLVTGENSQQTGGPLGDFEKLYDTLKQGLGDRISLLSVSPEWSESWDTGFAGPSPNLKKMLLVGFIVNSDTVDRTVDHGPSAEDKKEAASFRKFWGEKAELRRFKDGSILESLVWDTKEGQRVFEQIVRFLLNKHFGENIEQRLEIVGDIFRRLLPQTGKATLFQPVMEAYKQLEVDIRSLENLPLSIRQLMPSDPRLRYASKDASRRPQSPPADVTIQFEGSARWPDDLAAIQRTKIAFLLKISEQLQDSTDSLTSRIGLENEEHDFLNQGFLDIIYDSGAAFRLRVHHEREQAFIERKLKDKALEPRSREMTAVALAKYKRDYIKSPSFTQAIARLGSLYPALSGTTRLVKKWFASHLLSNHVAEEVIEMMVVRTFVQPWPWQTPSSMQTGFFRTLFGISRWDWKTEPLIVDLSGSGELKQADIQAITTRFEAWRKLDPALNRVVLFCGSNIDSEGTAWTDGRTPKVVAARMTALARAACAEVEERGLKLEPAALFTSPLTDFDFVVHFYDTFQDKRSGRKQPKKNGTAFKNLEMDVLGDASMVGYQAIQDFLRELETLYGSSVLFFSGDNERPVLAGLWNPQTAPRAWKLNLAYSTVPKLRSDQDETQADINKDAILAEIARIGNDIIERIDVNRH